MNPCMVMHGHILHHKAVVVPHASIISKNEVQCILFVCYVHPITQQHKRTVGKVRLYQSSYYE